MILLLKAPRYHESYFEENSESLALGSLASYLRNNGYNVKVFDASLEGLELEESKKNIYNLIIEEKPVIIGFTIADMTFIESTVEIVDYLKANGVKSHITIGGHAPTFNYKEIMELCPLLDSVICYEGEIALLELANALSENREWRTIQNLAYRDFDGSIKRNSPMPLIYDLDSLPFPARDYLPYVRTHLTDKGIVTMTSSRGCYNNCGFCSIRGFYGPPEGPLWRARSVDNIIEEINSLMHVYPDIKEIVFVDDLFLGHPKERINRLISFKEALQKHNIRIIFSISDRVDNINDEIGKLWHEIGVRQILIGLESGSQEILDKLNKGITLQQQKTALEILNKYDIDPTPSFINFTPWSTLEQIEASVRHFLTLNINLLQGLLNRFQIYDGTPLAGQLKSEGKVIGNFPNHKYIPVDKRVDTLYSIVESCFGPYLDIAYRLKMVERELRFVLFGAEVSSDKNEVDMVRANKLLFKNMISKIMEEAVGIFLETLDSCRNVYGELKPEICDNIYMKIVNKANLWVKMIETFKYFSPVLEMREVTNANK